MHFEIQRAELWSIQCRDWNCSSIPIIVLYLELKLEELKMELEMKIVEFELEMKTGIEFLTTVTIALNKLTNQFWL